MYPFAPPNSRGKKRLFAAVLWLFVYSHGLFANPLSVHPTNPRYFSDGSGKAIYLTGSHTWCNLSDNSAWTFDYNEYLDFLENWNHNFIRMWANSYLVEYAPPYPYERPGPGSAVDGAPKLDLNKFNQAYFDRMRSRIIAAGARGIYVGITVFPEGGKKPLDWDRHFFNSRNNINGTNGDPNGDGLGLEVQTLADSIITAFQEALIRKTVDTINDLDNVLYEIINEEGDWSTDWQYHMINYIKSYEASKPKQHMVGMTFQHPNGNNGSLFNSPADWISPRVSWDTPKVADGSKVVILDTDHFHPTLTDPKWAWKAFLRGNHPILMDWWKESVGPSQGDVRVAMGYTLTYANKMNLVDMTPQNNLASTGYCLAKRSSSNCEYLVYLPNGGSVTVDLSSSPGDLSVEWFNASSGTAINGSTTTGGASRSFTAPFEGHAVIHIVHSQLDAR